MDSNMLENKSNNQPPPLKFGIARFLDEPPSDESISSTSVKSIPAKIETTSEEDVDVVTIPIDDEKPEVVHTDDSFLVENGNKAQANIHENFGIAVTRRWLSKDQAHKIACEMIQQAKEEKWDEKKADETSLDYIDNNSDIFSRYKMRSYKLVHLTTNGGIPLSATGGYFTPAKADTVSVKNDKLPRFHNQKHIPDIFQFADNHIANNHASMQNSTNGGCNNNTFHISENGAFKPVQLNKKRNLGSEHNDEPTAKKNNV